MIVRVWSGRLLVVVMMAILMTAGCRDAQDPSVLRPEPNQPDSTLSSLIVSNPATTISSGRAVLHRSSGEDLVYISLAPGSIPNGKSIVVRNRRTAVVASAAIALGGVDPFPVSAVVGDTLDIRISLAGSNIPLKYISLVPLRRPPVIVRTDPPPGKRDVPLNSVLILVFSEPINPGLLNDSALQLFSGGSPVNGTVALADSAGLIVAFTPAQPLAPGTSYTLTATQGIEDVSGEGLEAPVSVTFTTENPAAPASPMVFDRKSPHYSGGSASRYTLYPGGAFELFYETNSDTVVYTGRDAEAYQNWIFFDFDEVSGSPEREAYGRMLDSAHLAIAYNWVMIQAGVEEGVYATSPDSLTSGFPSPAGQIAFVRNGGIYLVNSDGTGLTQLTSGPSDAFPAWSPDGQRIAFTRAIDSVHGGIFIMNADGSNVVQRTNGRVGGAPSWSPDGQWIVFPGHNNNDPTSSPGGYSQDLYKLPAIDDGSQPTNLTDRPGVEDYPAWSPDGSLIAFSSDWLAFDITFDIFLTTPSGSSPVLLPSGPLEEYLPAWSPDGQRLAFTSCPWAFFYCSSSALRVLDMAGQNVVHVAVTSGYDRATWASDGQTIVFGSYGDIGWVRADGSARGIIVTDGHHPAWRP